MTAGASAAGAVPDPLVEYGRCAVCGTRGTFERSGGPVREDHKCRACGASLRYRHQAHVLSSLYADGCQSLSELVQDDCFRSLDVYEPGLIGPFRRLFKSLPRYTTSYFWPDLCSGEMRNGVRCENIQALTFADACVDLLITSDVFEHVRDPWEGFGEVFRVLRPGGHHVFTVPFTWPLPGMTISRIDTSGPDDVLLMPAAYHKSPVGPEGSLVYTDFGLDAPERLRELGFRTVVHHGYRNNVTIVSTRPSVGE